MRPDTGSTSSDSSVHMAAALQSNSYSLTTDAAATPRRKNGAPASSGPIVTRSRRRRQGCVDSYAPEHPTFDTSNPFRQSNSRSQIPRNRAARPFPGGPPHPPLALSRAAQSRMGGANCAVGAPLTPPPENTAPQSWKAPNWQHTSRADRSHAFLTRRTEALCQGLK